MYFAGKQKKGRVEQFDSSDAESVTSTSTAFSELSLAHETEDVGSLEFTLEKYLDALYEKSFPHMSLYFPLYCRSITLLHHYLNSVKRGSAKEACLAARATGLLAITGATGSHTHEIMEESIPTLSCALKSGPDAVRISALDCLAIITFVGSDNWAETEMAMKIMWEIIHPKLLSMGGSVSKPSSSVLVAALSAWAFLLTTMSAWVVNLEMWTGMISFLCNLLDKDDRAVRIAAGEAIAVIFEIVVAGKLLDVTDDLETQEDKSPKPKWFTFVMSLKEKIISLVSNLSMEGGGKGVDKKNLNLQRDTFQKIYDFLKEGFKPKTSLKLSKKGVLQTSTWTELVQLNFLKHFLGSGFHQHAQENELLISVFGLTPDVENNLSVSQKRVLRSSGDRERTKELNKERQMAQLRKGALIFLDED
ncbi:hypothetical protein AXF42_Ash004347 [Apostasia shenzhenica]|uniref:Interferon-related developmental regulator N-terminal domain-containing protein n=1 Tax=Apostasia shenzhenica TaxID=1088818 RepID=A0A2I0A2N0_9ASPA|nr:hypothetical protein AXF42_Ash004347 [Apostasia shenzhenica]